MEGGYVAILGSWVSNTNSILDTEAFPSLIDLTMMTDREEDASLGGVCPVLRLYLGFYYVEGQKLP